MKTPISVGELSNRLNRLSPDDHIIFALPRYGAGVTVLAVAHDAPFAAVEPQDLIEVYTATSQLRIIPHADFGKLPDAPETPEHAWPAWSPSEQTDPVADTHDNLPSEQTDPVADTPDNLPSV